MVLHNTEDMYLEISKYPRYFMYILFGASVICMENGWEEVLKVFDNLWSMFSPLMVQRHLAHFDLDFTPGVQDSLLHQGQISSSVGCSYDMCFYHEYQNWTKTSVYSWLQIQVMRTSTEVEVSVFAVV
jgi:hypothetical protein